MDKPKLLASASTLDKLAAMIAQYYVTDRMKVHLIPLGDWRWQVWCNGQRQTMVERQKNRFRFVMP